MVLYMSKCYLYKFVINTCILNIFICIKLLIDIPVLAVCFDTDYLLKKIITFCLCVSYFWREKFLFVSHSNLQGESFLEWCKCY